MFTIFQFEPGTGFADPLQLADGGPAPSVLTAGAVRVVPAPECIAPGVVDIPGGGKDVVDGLAPGNHRFQCCIHPWMRTLVKVEAEDNDED